MSTKFFTNDGNNTLLNKFKGVFEHNKDIEFVLEFIKTNLPNHKVVDYKGTLTFLKLK